MGTSIEIKSVRVKIDSLETREGFLVCGLPRGLSLSLSLSKRHIEFYLFADEPLLLGSQRISGGNIGRALGAT